MEDCGINAEDALIRMGRCRWNEQCLFMNGEYEREERERNVNDIDVRRAYRFKAWKCIFIRETIYKL
jgi:hypothetical protein